MPYISHFKATIGAEMTTYTASRLQGIGVFVQAVDAGSFTSAAKRIGLSKSAVGKSVSTLEQRLGVRLLDRTTRRLALTAEGADFYQSCIRVLSELDDAESRAALQHREVTGRLRISLPVTFGRRWVMPILLDLAKQHPALTLDVSFSDRPVDLLEENIDLVVRLGDPGNSAYLTSRHLGHQTVLVCGTPTYFSEHGFPTSSDDLATHECITFGKEGYVIPWVLPSGDGRIATVNVKGRHTISDGDALRSAVLAGFGIAQLPTWLIADDLRTGRLVTGFAQQGVRGSPIHVLWPSTRDLTPKVRATVDALSSAFIPVAPWDADVA